MALVEKPKHPWRERSDSVKGPKSLGTGGENGAVGRDGGENRDGSAGSVVRSGRREPFHQLAMNEVAGWAVRRVQRFGECLAAQFSQVADGAEFRASRID